MRERETDAWFEEVYAILAMRAERVGPAKDAPECWEWRLNERWALAANGHPEDRSHRFEEGAPPVKVPPYHVALWAYGWLIGFVSPLRADFLGTYAQEVLDELRAAAEREGYPAYVPPPSPQLVLGV